jgi:hypothetical protein
VIYTDNVQQENENVWFDLDEAVMDWARFLSNFGVNSTTYLEQNEENG